MVLHTSGIATSQPDESLQYITCNDEDQDYGLSLFRYAEDGHIEVMVADQTNYRTSEVAAELYRDRLVVKLSAAAAKALEGIAEYSACFEMTDEGLRSTDAALRRIFAGVGHYERRF